MRSDLTTPAGSRILHFHIVMIDKGPGTLICPQMDERCCLGITCVLSTLSHGRTFSKERSSRFKLMIVPRLDGWWPVKKRLLVTVRSSMISLCIAMNSTGTDWI